MSAEIRPLLRAALNQIDRASDPEKEAVLLASRFGSGDGVSDTQLPIVIQVPIIRPKAGEHWGLYRERVWEERLRPLHRMLEVVMGLQPVPLFTANALQVNARPDQIQKLSDEAAVALMELDPLVQLTEMDDAVEDIGLGDFQRNHPTLNGADVKVAVLDSGIDGRHPFLTVSDSFETCGETTDLPGAHGTHCAGSIASQDPIFPGVAPKVILLDIKVLRANGTGRHTSITRGIDEALNRDAQVLSMSLGFNHLPTWSENGHGWSCPDGRCTLCTAVDNAVALENVIVVVAAANEHARAEALRTWGFSSFFDTELSCPGQAREALTVGALTKNTFLPASFSSRGPTAYGDHKPDLCAPGVNVTSTVPVPRAPTGIPLPNPPRSSLFTRMSGTSMATPIVAGAAALVIQRELNAGRSWKPADVKRELLTNGVDSLLMPENVVGRGRLRLNRL